ncbi:MAG: cadherin domain-containing protein, partial [Acidobacteriota bacterium]|nr:cadherin domain-containing protein [Acidobacteriota bacterium]
MRRYPAFALALAAVWSGPAATEAQNLFRIVEPEVAAAEGGPTGASAAARPSGYESHPGMEVVVDLELLRSGPPRLEIPVPGGGGLTAERAAFEDRGNGNAMWAGRVAGSEAETVVFTVQDGRLVGGYGELGERGFELVAGPHGAGAVRSAAATFHEEEPDWSYCAAPDPFPYDPPAATGADKAPARKGIRHAAGVETRGDEPPTHSIDLLVVYDQKAENSWTKAGVAAAIQALVDYSNTVLRNNELNASFKLAHREKITLPVDNDVYRHRSPELSFLTWNDAMGSLRDRHAADIVVFVTRNSRRRYCGLASITYSKGLTRETMGLRAFAEVNLICPRPRVTFIHEIGHLMGGSHGDQPYSGSLYPYAFGHRDASKSPTVYSIMRALSSSQVPVQYFSTVRVTPNGRTLGVKDRAENERAFGRTIPHVAGFAGALKPPSPRNFKGVAEEDGEQAKVTLTWTDRSSSETAFKVVYRKVGDLEWREAAALAADVETTTISGLDKATRYRFKVGASNDNGVHYTGTIELRTPGLRTVTVTVTIDGATPENATVRSERPVVTGHRGGLTWTLSGADAARFRVDNGGPHWWDLPTGVVSLGPEDHESPADADGDNVYEATLTATDRDGNPGSTSISVTVTNVNEAPVFSTSAALAISVPEGTAGNIGSPVTATDPEGAALAYSLTGADAGDFAVSSSGQLSVGAGTTLNHEQKSSYGFDVVVSDGGTPALTAARPVTVTVTDLDQTLTIAGLADGTVAENAAYASATPTVTGHAGQVTWSLEGADAEDFAISSAGVLSMAARDHEAPADDDKDNVYEVTAKAEDGNGVAGTASVAVTVTAVNEAPVFEATGTLTISVPEGTAGNIGSPVTATDPEGAALDYSLTGADAGDFAVSSSGQLSVDAGTTLSHQRKANHDFNVVVSDGETPPLTASRAVSVRVPRPSNPPPAPTPPRAPPGPT